MKLFDVQNEENVIRNFFVIEKNLKNKNIFSHIWLNWITINHSLKYLKLVDIVFKKKFVLKNRFVDRKDRV